MEVDEERNTPRQTPSSDGINLHFQKKEKKVTLNPRPTRASDVALNFKPAYHPSTHSFCVQAVPFFSRPPSDALVGRVN